MSKLMSKYNWGIDIHDAIICDPESAQDIKIWYRDELQSIYDNRHEILNNYFHSIGIGVASQVRWNQVKSLVKPIHDNFKVSLYGLK